jgi:hypothetical protein
MKSKKVQEIIDYVDKYSKWDKITYSGEDVTRLIEIAEYELENDTKLVNEKLLELKKYWNYPNSDIWEMIL